MFKTTLEKFTREIKKKQDSTQDYLKRAVQMIQFCRGILLEMKSQVDENDFDSVPEELSYLLYLRKEL